MEEVIELQGFRITPQFTEREVNFVVSDHEGYLFRLVPDLTGFDISPLDVHWEQASMDKWWNRSVTIFTVIIVNDFLCVTTTDKK